MNIMSVNTSKYKNKFEGLVVIINIIYPLASYLTLFSLQETLSNELNKTITVLNRIIELCNAYNFTKMEQFENSKIDFKLFNEYLIIIIPYKNNNLI